MTPWCQSICFLQRMYQGRKKMFIKGSPFVILKIHSSEHGQGCDFVLQWFFQQGKPKLNASYQSEVSKQQLFNLKVSSNNALGHPERWLAAFWMFSERIITHYEICRQDACTVWSLQYITSQETSNDKIYYRTLKVAPNFIHLINSQGSVIVHKPLYIILEKNQALSIMYSLLFPPLER